MVQLVNYLLIQNANIQTLTLITSFETSHLPDLLIFNTFIISATSCVENGMANVYHDCVMISLAFGIYKWSTMTPDGKWFAPWYKFSIDCYNMKF